MTWSIYLPFLASVIAFRSVMNLYSKLGPLSGRHFMTIMTFRYGSGNMTTRTHLNRTPGKRIDGEPEDEAEHFYVCKQCGQAVDMRRLGDMLHHEEPGHERIEVQ